VIFIHGGPFFSSGNNLSVVAKDPLVSDPDHWYSLALSMNLYAILTCTMAIKNSIKPIVGLVRGKAIGISFTLSSLFTFLYCTPEAKFLAPFSRSFQIPEGSSSYSFPQIFGKRKANELLFLSKELSAQEALSSGFVNEILPEVSNPNRQDIDEQWPDIAKIPTIGKLLKTD
jgi:enoyl-CoA hydratase/carnithine racemase